MPAHRWHILLRWMLCLCLPAFVLAWAKLQDPLTLSAPSPLPALQPPIFPTEAQKRCLDLVAGQMRQASPTAPQEVDASLLALPSRLTPEATSLEANTEASPSVVLSMILVSGQQRLAMLDGMIHSEGQLLPDGRVVKEIKRSGVLLQGSRSQEFIPWQAPGRVELIRQPQPDTQRKVTTTTQPSSTMQNHSAHTHSDDAVAAPPDTILPYTNPGAGLR